MSTLAELGDYFETNGLGIQGGQDGNLFLGSSPDDPDTTITLYQYPGGGPEYVQNSHSPNQETVQVQVVVRSKRYEEADALCSRAWRLLASIRNAVIGGTKYRSITPNNSPAVMGRDTNDRIRVFFNATVEKEVSLA